jgi:hypothetical protein
MRIWTSVILVAVLATGVTLPAATQAQEDKDPQVDKQEKEIQIHVTRVKDGDEDEEGYTVEVREAAMSKYWIGVLCEPVENELVKSQLDIKFGLVLEEVIDGGPAVAAGLKKFDILTEVDGKALDGLPMLGECIAKSEGKQLELTVLRNGKPRKITITPATRPKKFQTPLPQPMNDDPRAADEWKLLQEALRLRGYEQKEAEETEDGKVKEGRTSLYYFMPGIVLSGEADFPKDLEVTVTKVSGQPTKVIVKRGDEKWEVDEKSLDKLPKEIRPHIERMLGGGQVRMQWSAKPFDLHKLESLPNFNIEQFKFDPKLNLKIEKKLDELQLKMGEDVRKKVEKQLGELQEKVEKAQPVLSSEVLDQLRRELTSLRKELEQMQAERAKRRAEQSEAEDHKHEDDGHSHEEGAQSHDQDDDDSLSQRSVRQIIMV